MSNDRPVALIIETLEVRNDNEIKENISPSCGLVISTTWSLSDTYEFTREELESVPVVLSNSGDELGRGTDMGSQAQNTSTSSEGSSRAKSGSSCAPKGKDEVKATVFHPPRRKRPPGIRF